jgi:hypothetical protein
VDGEKAEEISEKKGSKEAPGEKFSLQPTASEGCYGVRKDCGAALRANGFRFHFLTASFAPRAHTLPTGFAQ